MAQEIRTHRLPDQGVRSLLFLALTWGLPGAVTLPLAQDLHAAPLTQTEAPVALPTRARGDSSRRGAARWEVRIVQPDGRRQVFAGRRERSRDSRVFVLIAEGPGASHAGSAPTPGDARRICPGPVERIEGGFVAPPRATRCASAGR